MIRSICSILLVGLLVGCSSSDDATPTVDGPSVNADGGVDLAVDAAPVDPSTLGLTTYCPGAAGCMSNEGPLLAGASALTLSPTDYELPRVAYLQEESFCAEPTPQAPFGLRRCGPLVDDAKTDRKDCGLDGLCPEDNLRTRISCSASDPCEAPLTCNEGEQRCYLAYSAPDADGSEGDGAPDYFLDCGNDRVCPCLDPEGQPAYFGADGESCLTGHSENPAYSAADADGSEGNGVFELMYMAGFDNDHPFLGQHDDIWARALVLRTGEVTVAIVSLDVVGFYNNAVEKVRARLAEQGAEIDYLLISSTHGHEGPDTMGQWGPAIRGFPSAPGVNPTYFDWLLDRVAEAVVEAQGRLAPATLTAGMVRTGREGFFTDGRDPRILRDELTVLKLDDSAGATIATLVNWSNHPETLSDTNNYLSSDYPHYLREAVEQTVPAAGEAPELAGLGGVAIFVQGTLGCLMTPLGAPVRGRDGTLHGASSFAKAEALGTQLAVKVREALAAGETIADPRLAVRAKQFDLPVENRAFQMAMGLGIFDRKPHGYDSSKPAGPDNMPKVRTEIGLIELGSVTLYSVPGELAPEIAVGGYDGSRSLGLPLVSGSNPNPPDIEQAPAGPYLDEKMPGKYPIPVGLGNDELGYILPAFDFLLSEDSPYLDEADEHYEETNSLGPQTETLLLQAYDELLSTR